MPAGSFQVQIGSSRWDAVSYVRYKTEDADSAAYIVPDEAYKYYAEAAAEQFSLHMPAGEIIVGNPQTLTSPLQTVANQQRYICNAGNGFTSIPTRITDALYRATNAFSAASEVSYLALLPFSPINRFLFTPSLLDSPSERILRDEYLSELDKYGLGFVVAGRDPATGLMALDLYPIPVSGGTPIYVVYQVGHTHTVDATLGFFVYATIPEDFKFAFAKLLLAEVLEEDGIRLARAAQARAGMTQLFTDPERIERRVQELKDEVVGMLGGNQTVALASY